nr:unnamed protein product [Digitaria exilis]
MALWAATSGEHREGSGGYVWGTLHRLLNIDPCRRKGFADDVQMGGEASEVEDDDWRRGEEDDAGDGRGTFDDRRRRTMCEDEG